MCFAAAGDFVSIFEKTLRQVFATFQNAIDTRAENKTLKDDVREHMKEVCWRSLRDLGIVRCWY
jgi:hypothetical protein